MKMEEKETVSVDNALEVKVTRISPEELEEAIKAHDVNKLKEITKTVNDIDIADALKDLDPTVLMRFFRDVPSSVSANIFDEMPSDSKEKLISSMADKELVELVNSQSADDLADTIGDMPANLAIRIMRAAAPDMREDINRLLKFKPDTAGAIMTTEFLEFKDDLTVKETIRAIRAKGRDAETIYTVFVRDASRKFVGTVDLDDLIFAESPTLLKDIMNRDAPSVRVDTDKEEMANAFRRYDLNAIAVLNDDGCLSGIVTVDDAVDVMTQATTEDIESLHGVAALEDSYLETHPMKMAKKCVPWLIVLLILGTFSSMVLSSFQDALSVVPVLAAFIPTLMDTGGNAGGQTIALMIRGLALGEFKPKEVWKLVGREIISALIIGLMVALFSFLWFTMEQYFGIVQNGEANIWLGNCWTTDFFLSAIRVSAVVSLTMFIAILASKVIAVLLPMLSAALKKDPAIVSQPLLTTIVDVSSLIIFFAISEAFIIPFI